MSRSVFISYARKNEQLVELLSGYLKSLGYKVWYDDQITGGSDWWGKILDNIRKADVIITAVSADFLGSVACQREYRYALSLQKPLLPVRVDPSVDPTELRVDLQRLHMEDFIQGDNEKEKETLKRALANLSLTTAMPDSLPEPPAIPLDPIVELKEQVLNPKKLSEEDQVLLLYQIKKEASRNQNKHEVIELLDMFLKRNDLLGVVASEVEEYKHLSEGNLVMLKKKGAALETDKQEFIDAAENEIWFVGATMHYTAGNRRETLLSKLKEDVSVRALILDPDGKMYEANAAQFGQAPKRLKLETDMTILGFQDLHKEWNSYLESSGKDSSAILDVRVIDEVFSTGVYLFDPEHANSRMVLIPHVIGHDATEVPGFIFNHVNEKYIKLYSGKIRTAWGNGTSIFE